jgi:hypothetical protein
MVPQSFGLQNTTRHRIVSPTRYSDGIKRYFATRHFSHYASCRSRKSSLELTAPQFLLASSLVGLECIGANQYHSLQRCPHECYSLVSRSYLRKFEDMESWFCLDWLSFDSGRLSNCLYATHATLSAPNR